MTWDLTVAWFKQLLAVGAPSVVIALGMAYGLFRFVGTKWLETQFAGQLEKRKHDQQKELEQLRDTIQRMFSRISKIHEKEFDVLPEAWFLLHDAYGAAMIAVGATLRFLPNFENMPDEQLEEFLQRTKLTPYQKKELKGSSDRRTYYSQAVEGIAMDEAKEKHRLFNNYLIKNRIFLDDDLRTKFGAVSQNLIQGLTSYDVAKGSDYKLEREGFDKIRALQEKIAEVEQAVQKRLHYYDA